MESNIQKLKTKISDFFSDKNFKISFQEEIGNEHLFEHIVVNVNDISFEIYPQRIGYDDSNKHNREKGIILIKTRITGEVPLTGAKLRKMFEDIKKTNKALKENTKENTFPNMLIEKDAYIHLIHKIPYTKAAFEEFLENSGKILFEIYQDYNNKTVMKISKKYNTIPV